MRHAIPAWIRISVLFLIIAGALEFFVDSGDNFAFIEYPLLGAVLLVILLFLIAAEVILGAVENIMFDRSKYWDELRSEFRRKEQVKRILLAALIGVIALFIGFILFRAVSKEMERRRRLKEEQLALEQQRMREAALRAAEEEGIDVELSLEEKARLELQESAINLAKERPDDVAQLLRTWLAEE